jgi:aminodeoxyfutalosine synthase
MAVSEADLDSLVHSDILTLGMRADEARRQRHGRRTTFLRVLPVPAAVDAPIPAVGVAGELRITGTPESRAAAIARVSEVVGRAGGIPVSAFLLSDLEALAARERLTLRALLEDLHAAGLELVAEAPLDLLQDVRRSIEEVNIAGLALARLTVEKLSDADSLEICRQVAALQETVGVIRAFAPLPRRLNPSVPTTGYEDVKRVAVARLAVTSVPSIQVDWTLYGPKLAQVALTVGADDVDAVAAVDDFSQGPRRTAFEEVRRNIIAAGLEPVERNGRFEVIAR